MYDYDLSTDGGKVRLLIPDNIEADHIFEDEEIETFLILETGIKRAAALALETIASQQAMVLKVIRILDLSTDGAKVADALRARAASLRGQAEADDELAAGDSFAIVEWVVDPFTWRQAVIGQHWGLY